MTRRCVGDFTELHRSEDVTIYLVRNVEMKRGSELKGSQKAVSKHQGRL